MLQRKDNIGFAIAMPEDRSAEQKASTSEAADNLSQFIAVVSHELRTPLSAFLTTIELLSETDLDDRQRAYVDTLKEAAESGLILSDLLLSLRRDNSEPDEIDERVFKPADALRYE